MTDTSREAVERLAARMDVYRIEISGKEKNPGATLRVLLEERDALKQSLEKAVFACEEQARARGEAEGKLAASEMAGVVDGWKARAEAAEARVEELERLCEIMSKFIAGDSTQRGVQAAYEFRKANNTGATQ